MPETSSWAYRLLAGSEEIDLAGTIEEALDIIENTFELDCAEDVVLWHRSEVVAVFRSDGACFWLSLTEPDPRPSPIDPTLARLLPREGD